VILTRKRSQGIAIANYLTEQNIPLLSSDVDDPKRNRGEADYSSLKYLKNNADLEATHFLHYIAENIQDQLPVHDFIAKEWNKNWKSILRNG
jgi:hypothetical protein